MLGGMNILQRDFTEMWKNDFVAKSQFIDQYTCIFLFVDFDVPIVVFLKNEDRRANIYYKKFVQ